MTELEIAMTLLGNCLQYWKLFVDDTFVFVLHNNIGYIVKQLNWFSENIQFTFDMEEENKLALLDVIVIRNTNDTINTTAYRKLARRPEVLSVKKVFLEILQNS